MAPRKKRPFEPLAALRALDPRARLRVLLGGGAVVVLLAAVATCGACRGPKPGTAVDATVPSASKGRGRVESDAASLRNSVLWNSAKDGEVEDLATLAAQEGALGLVEAASDRELRPTAIRAMGYAAGWSQLPFLVQVSSAKDDEEARLALDATVELAARPRRAEDPEDADELREGCEGLGALARDAARPRPRRIAAIRALRMMPCPPFSDGGELPTDLDAK